MDALPPQEIRLTAPAPNLALSQKDAEVARQRLTQALPNTKIARARPASLPGLVQLELEDGKIAYTDRTGRYLILGVIFDTVTGSALDNQLDGLSE